MDHLCAFNVDSILEGAVDFTTQVEMSAAFLSRLLNRPPS